MGGVSAGAAAAVRPTSLDDDRQGVTDPHADTADATDGESGDSDSAARDATDAPSEPEWPPESDAAAVGGVGDGDAIDPETVMSRLIEIDALAEDEETVGLTESFREALDARIGSLRDEDDKSLAERAAAISGEGVTGYAHDGRIMLAGAPGVWLPRAIALAEVAAASELRERGVGDALSREAARPIRMLLDTCPVCDGPIAETTLGQCLDDPNGDPDLSVRACTDCDAILFGDQR